MLREKLPFLYSCILQTRFPPQKKIVVVEKDMSGEPSKLNANTHTTNGNTNTEDVSIKPTSESNVELNIDKSGKTESSQAGDDIDGNTISEKKAEKEETSGEANVNQPEQQFEQIIEKPEDTDKQEGKAEQYPSQMQHEHEHHYLKKERQERRRSDKNGHRGGDIVVEPLKPQDPNLLPACRCSCSTFKLHPDMFKYRTKPQNSTNPNPHTRVSATLWMVRISRAAENP